MGKKIAFPIRMLMQFVSFLLCLVLVVSLFISVSLLDLKMLTSSGGIQAVLDTVMGSSSTSPTAAAPRQGYISRLNSGDIPGDIQLPDNVQIPNDALTDSNLLTDYIYDIIKESVGQDINITHDQVQQFVEASTIMDFTSEKMASYVEDAMNGTQNTTITADELMGLLEENQGLLEEHFDITITEETKAQLRTEVERVVEDEDLNGTIRKEIDAVLEQPIEGTDYTVNDILLVIGQITANGVIFAVVGFCLLIILLMLAANFYNLPMGLTWASIACLFTGVPLSLLALGLQYSPMAAVDTQVMQIFELTQNLAEVVAPVHYAVAIVGILLLAGSITWRVLRASHK